MYGTSTLPDVDLTSWARRAFNLSHVRARCNLAVEEFKRGKGRGKAGGTKARGSQGAGDELVEGGDLEEQTAAAAAAEVLHASLVEFAKTSPWRTCTRTHYGLEDISMCYLLVALP